MGVGDQLIASGLARDAWTKRGVKIAFGDGNRVIFDKHSDLIFRNNPNIVFPGNEGRSKIEWIAFYKGSRGYNRQGDGHWIWNMDWRTKPGQMFFSHGEEAAGRRHGKGFVVIEPNVVRWKSSAENKDWGFARYQQLADRMIADGQQVMQIVPRQDPLALKLNGVKIVKTDTFRDAVTILKHAAIYVGAEGGMHHAAGALGVRGVVIFGDWIPPSVTGYEGHTNITSGEDRFCGSFKPCEHCKRAMQEISVDRVFSATKERLTRG